MVAELSSRLQRSGFEVVTTREPGGTPEGLALRALLVRPQAAAWEPWAELLLMIAARVQHIERVIRPAVAAGKIVISDRFVGSTIAYQGAGRGLPIASIERLHREACGDLWPDLTVVLDVVPAVGLRRAQNRLSQDLSDEGRFEQLELAFHQRVRNSFLSQAHGSPGRHAVVDAGQSCTDVAAAVADAVQAWLDAEAARTRPG